MRQSLLLWQFLHRYANDMRTQKPAILHLFPCLVLPDGPGLQEWTSLNI